MTSSKPTKVGSFHSQEKRKKMAITKIQYQSSCPYGHEEIDFVDLEHRKYVYCYECKKKYFQEDYEC